MWGPARMGDTNLYACWHLKRHVLAYLPAGIRLYGCVQGLVKDWLSKGWNNYWRLRPSLK